MLVVLKAISAGASNRQVQLRSGQILKVGRSGWADFSIDNDSSMKEEHFEIHCSPDGCRVRSLGPDASILINGEPVSSGIAFDGDEIHAGSTRFRLIIQGGPVRQVPEEAAPAAEEAQPEISPQVAAATAAAALGLAGLCGYLDFSDDVKLMAESSKTADELIGKLTAEEKFMDALRLRAYSLEKRKAVWWGCYCCRKELDSGLPVEQSAAVDAAGDWAEDPCESKRRTAESKAAAANYSGPGATLALSAFWSEGSLAPEGSPEVPADERLTSQGVAGALVTAAYLGDPTKAPKRFRVFLDRGQDFADGKIQLPGEN
jgi:hypothetical protein